MKTLIVGIGSTILSDDGVGVRVVERLRSSELPSGVDTVELGTAGLSLLDLVDGYDRLVETLMPGGTAPNTDDSNLTQAQLGLTSAACGSPVGAEATRPRNQPRTRAVAHRHKDVPHAADGATAASRKRSPCPAADRCAGTPLRSHPGG